MRHVDLSHNMIDDAGVRLLIDSSWQLESLDLSNNWPTTDGNGGVQAPCKGKNCSNLIATMTNAYLPSVLWHNAKLSYVT